MNTNAELAEAMAALLAAQATAPEPAHNPTPTLLTVDETATLLRCGKTLIYVMLQDGRLSGVRLGRRRLVRAADVQPSDRSRRGRRLTPPRVVVIPDSDRMTDTIWLIEHAAAIDADIHVPPTTAHRTETRCRAAIANVAAGLGINPAEAAEEVHPTCARVGHLGPLG